MPEKAKNKLISKSSEIEDLIKSDKEYEKVSEIILHKLILENIESFMKELGNGFTFVGREYKIKIGDRYNYVDLLLFNINFNCFVVIELQN